MTWTVARQQQTRKNQVLKKIRYALNWRPTDWERMTQNEKFAFLALMLFMTALAAYWLLISFPYIPVIPLPSEKQITGFR